MKKIREKINKSVQKIKTKSKEKIKNNFSTKSELILFVLIVFLGLFILQVHYSNFAKSYPVYNPSQDPFLIRDEILKNDLNKPLNFHYISSGDIYCLYKNGEELFIKNNSVLFINNKLNYYAVFGKTIINQLELEPINDKNSQLFFDQIGKPMDCEINVSESKGFYKKALNAINSEIN